MQEAYAVSRMPAGRGLRAVAVEPVKADEADFIAEYTSHR
jgi:hypothetical protein